MQTNSLFFSKLIRMKNEGKKIKKHWKGKEKEKVVSPGCCVPD